MAAILTLQGLDLDLETQAEVFGSTNSVYACILISAHSIAC